MLNKGFMLIETVIALVTLALLLLIPIKWHQSIVRKQAIMAKTGVEMSYWDVFWTDPKLRYNQGKIIIEDD